MSRLSDTQVDAIAQQVLQRLAAGAGGASAGGRGEADSSGQHRLGSFRDMDAAVSAAQKAFQALDKMELEKREEIIANIRKAALRESESLAFAAHRETGFGRYEDKIIKNRLVATKTPGPEILVASKPRRAIAGCRCSSMPRSA